MRLVVFHTGKVCTIRPRKFPEIPTGIFGRIESAHFFTTRTTRRLVYTLQVSLMICNSPTVRLVKHCFTTRTSRTTRTGRVLVYTLQVSLMIYRSPTVRLVNHCFTTSSPTVRLVRVARKGKCHYTGRISSCILDNTQPHEIEQYQKTFFFRKL